MLAFEAEQRGASTPDNEIQIVSPRREKIEREAGARVVQIEYTVEAAERTYEIRQYERSRYLGLGRRKEPGFDVGRDRSAHTGSKRLAAAEQVEVLVGRPDARSDLILGSQHATPLQHKRLEPDLMPRTRPQLDTMREQRRTVIS